ncbi:MAG TPA: CDP-alcohol phosphatidyltransferase family protein [Geminicoccaceae bacterium]
MKDGVSAADLRAGYRGGSKAAEDRNEAWTYHVVRPASFHVAAAFMRAGITANQVTWLSMIVLVGGCLLLGFGSYPAAVLGAVLINGWLLLDCADGNIARHHGTFSTYGAFLDTIGGYAAYALVFLAAGLGACNRPDEVWLAPFPNDPGGGGAVWLLLGAWASIAALWTRLVFQKFKNSFGALELRRHDAIGPATRRSWRRTLMSAGNNLLNVSGGLLVLLFLAVLLGALDLFLLLAASGNTVVLVLTFAWLLRRAAAAAG